MRSLMQCRGRWIALGLAVAAIVLLAANSFPAFAEETGVVQGWVEILTEDEDGRIEWVYIDDAEQGWFVVEHNENGERLMDMVGKEVKARGVITQDPDDPDRKRITVTDFVVVGELPEEEDDGETSI